MAGFVSAARAASLAAGRRARSDNVRAALNLCTPGGVDFNSGVEDAPGRKNADKMAAAVAAANPKGNGNMS